MRLLVLGVPLPRNWYGLESGRRAAVTAILGVCTGMSLYTVAVVAGLGALVDSHSWLLTALKIFGAAYLLWLGISALRSPKRTVARSQGLEPGWWYLRGVVVSVTNPKIVLFFLAFLPQFIGDALNPALQLALLGGIDILIELILYGTVGVLAGVFHSHFEGNPRTAKLLNCIACIVYLLLSAVVIVDLLSQGHS